MANRFSQAHTPFGKMLMAFLLVVQLLCVVSSAFAADSADDIHHSYPNSYQDSYQDNYPVAAADLSDSAQHIDCDHCSHCHVAHIGLFKTSPALAVVNSDLLVGYRHQLPSSPNRSIYRPPIH